MFEKQLIPRATVYFCRIFQQKQTKIVDFVLGFVYNANIKANCF